METFKDWQPELGGFGTVDETNDIHQCILTILNTPKGSAALYPTFGSDIYKYVDYPVDVVTPHVVRETILALEEWEPRITLNDVKVSFLDEKHLTLQITWQLINDAEKDFVTFLEVKRGS